MKITERIKKLERTFETGSGEFCHCSRKPECSVLEPDCDKSDADRDRERAEWLKPRFCDKCGKRILRHLIEIVWTENGPDRIVA